MNDDDNKNDLVDKFGKIYVAFTKKFDGISEKINERTGWHINVGNIVGIILMIVVVIIFVKAVLGVVMGKLFSGNYN